ncbi:MAG: hypothetical protein ACQEQF_00340 [Bacillota bacterium]
MPLLNDGRDLLTSLAVNSGTALDNTNAQLNIGNGTTAVSASQSSLQGTSTAVANMDSDYPLIDPDNDGSNNKLRFKATFGDTEANFGWEEWGVSNGTKFLNRLVDTQGTKISGTTWIFEVDITIIIGT